MELKNGQTIQIHLETQVLQNNERAEFVFDMEGQLVKMGDTLYIRYKEKNQEEPGEVPVTIKIEPGELIQIMRGQGLHTRLKFAFEKRVPMSYPTDYGIFTIESYTPYLHFSLKDRPLSGSLELDYELFLENEKMGSYQMRLSFHS